MIDLTEEQRRALDASPEVPARVTDPATLRVAVLLKSDDMSVRRGEVVRVDWPYSDRTGSKVRPAVVVQDDSLNGLIADTLLVLTESGTGTPVRICRVARCHP
jgi:hypothetical protein